MLKATAIVTVALTISLQAFTPIPMVGEQLSPAQVKAGYMFIPQAPQAPIYGGTEVFVERTFTPWGVTYETSNGDIIHIEDSFWEVW